MKIAFLSPFYPYRGGIAQFSDLLYEELAKDYQVTAFNFSRQYPSTLFPGKTQYVTEKYPGKNFTSYRLLDSLNPLTWLSMGKKIRTGNFDLLIVSYWMPFFAISTGKPARISNCRTIGLMHNVLAHEKRPGDTALTKYFLNSCHGFAIMNDSSAEDLLKLKINAKYKILHHPIYSQYEHRIDKEEARKILGIDQSKKVLLFFGFIRDYKGYDILLESLKYLDDTYYLITAGEVYGSFDKYNGIITQNNLRDKIKLELDYISDAKVPLYFSASDVCILPYRNATQSGITATSYHFETPLIVSDAGGLSETIENDNSGLVFSKTEPKTLAETIKKYFGTDNSIFVNNIRKAKDKYSWKNFADGILDLAQRV